MSQADDWASCSGIAADNGKRVMVDGGIWRAEPYSCIQKVSFIVGDFNSHD